MIVERSWTERTKEKLKMVLIQLPFFVVSTYLVFFVAGGVIAGMILLIMSIFIIIPISLMIGVNLDYYKEVENENG